MIWPYLLIFGASCLILMKAGAAAVKSLSKIAQVLKWEEFTVAFLLMAFTTTLPELFVGLTSALQKTPQLAFGNIIGSNVVHLTLVVAICAIVGKGLKAESAIVKRASVYTAFVIFLPLLLLLDGVLSRTDGIILLAVLALYFYQLAYQKGRFSRIFKSEEKSAQWLAIKNFLKEIGFFLLAVLFLFLSAEGLVWSSAKLAQEMGISLFLLGILFIAIGTNLPEIIFGLKAIRFHHKDMVLGNLLGAIAVNSSFVLGITVLIHPLEVENLSPYLIGIIFTVLAILFFNLFARSNKEITRREGFILLLLYFIFILSQIVIS